MVKRKASDGCPVCRKGQLVPHCMSPRCDEVFCPVCRSLMTTDGAHTFTPPPQPKEPSK